MAHYTNLGTYLNLAANWAGPRSFGYDRARGAELMSVSLELIRRLTRQGALAIPTEVAGCLLLAAVEQCLEGRRVSARSLLLESNGTVTANLDTSSPSSLDALKESLAGLVGDSPEGARLRDGRGAASVEELAAALRAALLPLNRPAARRSLVRLYRQIEKLGVALEETALRAPPELPAEDGPAPLAAARDGFREAVASPQSEGPSSPDPVTPLVIEATPVVTRPVPMLALEPEPTGDVVEVPPVEPREAWEDVFHALQTTPVAEAPSVPSPVGSGAMSEAVLEPNEPTMLLGTLRVGPHDRTRVPQWLGAPSEAATQPIFALQTPPPGDCGDPTPDPGEAEAWTFPPPAENEATVIESIEVDREPGLLRVVPSRSDVRELLATFHVTEATTEEQLLHALRRSVENHGTPLPPAVGSTLRRAQ